MIIYPSQISTFTVFIMNLPNNTDLIIKALGFSPELLSNRQAEMLA